MNQENLSTFLQIDNLIKNEYLKNEWIKDSTAKIYIRKAYKILYTDQEKLLTTLDLATIEVEENHRRKGIFKGILNYMHSVNPLDATFIENAHNLLLVNYLSQNDWEEALTPLCYYKLK